MNTTDTRADAAVELLRDVLPKIPTLAGRNEAEPTPARLDARGHFAGLIVDAIRDGITADEDIAILLLADLLTEHPGALVDMALAALETIVGDIQRGSLVSDADGNALPRIDVDDSRPIDEPIRLVIAECQA